MFETNESSFSLPAKSEMELREQEETTQARDLLLKLFSEANQKETILSQEELIRREVSIKTLLEHEEGISKFLETFEQKNISLKEIAPNLFALSMQNKHHEFDNLPEGYAFKGGAGRAILLRELGIDPYAQARDIDPIRITSKSILGLDDQIAQKFSPDDFANKKEDQPSVEPLKDDYFQSRDFTINEVLATSDSLYLTKQCLFDTIRRIVCFTDFSKEELYENNSSPEDFVGGYFIKSKLLAKAVRFVAQEAVKGKNMELADKEPYQYLVISDFDIALHLDRAFEEGPKAAINYIETLMETGSIQTALTDPRQVIVELARTIANKEGFILQHIPKKFLQAEIALIDELAPDDPFFETEAGKKYKSEMEYGDYDDD